MAETTTQVFEVRTFPEVVKLCQNLIRLKERAPASLRLTIAITASRDVGYLGAGEDGHRDLTREVRHLLD